MSFNNFIAFGKALAGAGDEEISWQEDDPFDNVIVEKLEKQEIDQDREVELLRKIETSNDHILELSKENKELRSKIDELKMGLKMGQVLDVKTAPLSKDTAEEYTDI